MRNAILAMGLYVLLVASPAYSQVAPEATPTPSNAPLLLFLDCQARCDADFLRTEIPYVDYARERQDADVHLLVTSQTNGAGGAQYNLQFIGRRGFEGLNDELQFSSGPSDSPDRTRRNMGRTVAAGLVRYLVRTPMAERLDLSVTPVATAAGAPAAQRARDPWNGWVLRTGLGGSFSGESSYSQSSWNASANANRTTTGWKNVMTLSTRESKNTTQLGEREVVNRQSDRTASSLTVKSLTDHLSAGGRTNFNRSTFLNRDLAVRVAPAIEYNFFPYSESTRRQFTVQYSAGANTISYDEETIFGKKRETLADQALTFSGSMTQRWGSIRASVEGSHYFHDTSKYHVFANTNLELRLIRGLSLNFSGSAERIRDQLHLSAGKLTPEQILLRQKQIATSARYFGSVNLSFSFGSVYNAVVNPRMGGGGGGGTIIMF